MADINIDASKVIRQIKTNDNDVYTIDAPLWEGKRFSEVEAMIHGVVDTYVIPAQDNGTADYKNVVESIEAQVSISKVGLNTLTSSTSTYKVGDVILMGATSDGTNNFDRWVSKVSGDTIYLDVLETQVATHHHTIGVSYSSSKALTGISSSVTTTKNVANVGNAISNVLTGESGNYVTSITYSDKNEDIVTLDDNLSIATATSTDGGTGHKHTISAHSHSVKFKPSTMVSQTVSAYTSLTSANYTPHKHSVVSVAGVFESDSASAFTYAYDKKSTDTFIKSVTNASSTTDTGAATPYTNEVGLTTTTQTSEDEISDIVKTQSTGGHTHTATTTVTTSVVTAATVQTSVITSVSWSITAPAVQPNVMTGWAASVDVSGILSFGCDIASQTNGSTTIKVSRLGQSRTYGKPTITTTISEAGDHQHGFSHTHTIADHKHTVDSHTHTYYKTVVSETGNAITELSTKTYTPHKHTNISAAGVQSDDATAMITYINGGTTTDVVQNMKDTDQSCTVGNNTSALETDTKYYKITGDVKFPGLTAGYKTITTQSITPAVDSGEKAIKSITFTSSDFITGVTLVSGDSKTSTNIGGK